MEDPHRYPATQERRLSLHLLREPTEKTRQVSFPALPERLRPGDALGEYRIEREISSGATATVYQVEELPRGRRVALKVLSPHLGLVPEAVTRFKAEAAFTERVEHPAVMRVHGSGKDKSRYFYAMTLESGETAERLVTEAAESSDEAFYYRVALQIARVAEGLQALHDQGIVHRDIKPENLLLGADGELVLCDFGSSLDARERSPVLEKSLWGTVRYLAPEQFRSEADPYNASMDIYALGLSLYECVTGAFPFPRCNEAEMARLKLTRLPPAPRSINQRVPLGLDAVIRQAIEPSPLLRYPTAAELAGDLERFGSHKRGHRR